MQIYFSRSDCMLTPMICHLSNKKNLILQLSLSITSLFHANLEGS